jgi:hypothetical protein
MLDLQGHLVVDLERTLPPDRAPSSGPRERWHASVVTETFRGS